MERESRENFSERDFGDILERNIEQTHTPINFGLSAGISRNLVREDMARKCIYPILWPDTRVIEIG